MEMSEMYERPRTSTTTSVAVDEPIPEASAGVPLVEVPGAEVLVTEQKVVLSTAAALAPRRQGARHRFLTRLSRVLAGSTNAPHRRSYAPPYYLECARLSREMGRL
jgi:hypothetical protein